MLEDPRGNFFIAVWDHVGLTGAREPHADPVSSLWHKITLSDKRIWVQTTILQNGSQRLVPYTKIKTLCRTQVFLSIPPNHPWTSAEIYRPEAYSGLPSWKMWCCDCCHTFYCVLLHQALNHWTVPAVTSCPAVCTSHSSLWVLGISPGAHATLQQEVKAAEQSIHLSTPLKTAFPG